MQILEHRLLFVLVSSNNCSLMELQYLPHLSQSNNLIQPSRSIFNSTNLSHTASPPSQLHIVPTPGEVTVQPVRFNVVNGEKLGENFPIVTHNRKCSMYAITKYGPINKCVVLDFHDSPVIIVSQVDFLCLPTTNLFVAFRTYFLANQNIMSCI